MLSSQCKSASLSAEVATSYVEMLSKTRRQSIFGLFVFIILISFLWFLWFLSGKCGSRVQCRRFEFFVSTWTTSRTGPTLQVQDFFIQSRNFVRWIFLFLIFKNLLPKFEIVLDLPTLRPKVEIFLTIGWFCQNFLNCSNSWVIFWSFSKRFSIVVLCLLIAWLLIVISTPFLLFWKVIHN